MRSVVVREEVVGLGELVEVGAGEGVVGVGAADEEGGDEDVGFIDEMGVEEGGEDVGAALDEDVGVVLGGEVGEEGLEAEAAGGVCRDGEGPWRRWIAGRGDGIGRGG